MHCQTQLVRSGAVYDYCSYRDNVAVAHIPLSWFRSYYSVQLGFHNKVLIPWPTTLWLELAAEVMGAATGGGILATQPLSKWLAAGPGDHNRPSHIGLRSLSAPECPPQFLMHP